MHSWQPLPVGAVGTPRLRFSHVLPSAPRCLGCAASGWEGKVKAWPHAAAKVSLSLAILFKLEMLPREQASQLATPESLVLIHVLSKGHAHHPQVGHPLSKKDEPTCSQFQQEMWSSEGALPAAQVQLKSLTDDSKHFSFKDMDERGTYCFQNGIGWRWWRWVTLF